jgi:hypothetical protein
MFQVINTQALPAVHEAQAGLIESREWKGKEDLRGMGETELRAILAGLKGRLEREGRIADGLRAQIETCSEEYEWGMRVDGGDEDVGEGDKDDKAEDDDLFGEDEDEPEGSAKGQGKEVEGQGEGVDGNTAQTLAPNPREAWTIADYVRYMDTGSEPKMAV